MELFLDILGWILLLTILGGVFYIFYKILGSAFKSLFHNDAD